MIVGRGKRECEISCFDREAISTHDIGFLGVVDDMTDDFIDAEKAGDSIDSFDVITDSIEVDGGGELEISEVVNAIGVCDGDTGDTDSENADEGEAGEVDEINEVIDV